MPPDTPLNAHSRAPSAARLAGLRPSIVALLCAPIFLPLLPLALQWLAPMAGIAIPAGLAPATAYAALACLCALLVIAWRTGALRGGFVLAFAAALLLLPLARHFQLI